MELLIFLIPAIAIGYFIYKGFASRRMTVTDDQFTQNGVTVIFSTGKIKINKHEYDAKQVTGIKTITHPDAKNVMRAATGYVKVEVDDFKHPVHQLTVVGGAHATEQFSQRLCVAIRKAGGKDFY